MVSYIQDEGREKQDEKRHDEASSRRPARHVRGVREASQGKQREIEKKLRLGVDSHPDSG